jgi:biopolymer transport protein TolR
MHPMLNAAPFAALFLVLVPITIAIVKMPMGEAVQIATSNCDPQWETADSRIVLAYVRDDGYVQLNSEMLKFEDLNRRLYEIFRTRSERVLFLSAAPDVRFQTVANIIDVAKGQSKW